MTILRRLITVALLAMALFTSAGAATAPASQAFTGRSSTASSVNSGGSVQVGETVAAGVAARAREALEETQDPGAMGEEGRLSAAVEIALLLTVLSLLPAILITLTSFTRIVIVLSFVRRALSLNELPPNPVIIGLALFLTMFVMAPVGKELYAEAWTPYEAGDISVQEMGDRAWGSLSTFLVANTREKELRLFADLSGNESVFEYTKLAGQDGTVHASTDDPSVLAPDGVKPDVDASDLPLTVVIPAFILSELKTAFQMGFLLFLPFLVIDLVVSSVLLSMGMFMLPPVMISTPIKVLIFVLVDGWRLVTESVVTSFVMQAAS
ncbi:Flagellar biosynthetic protein FliP precursor [Planctomycetes bacterium Poly30]|uniref:Flagellar biosynthetic protein FliP n=1 Tax=Saltatorellus ferox TaxID=2528018 RepID=A0A518ELQ1_9BACT|nr:Flagellar biosynthetic protein FliP precursor [Planctomycetes bacterium Poly30]